MKVGRKNSLSAFSRVEALTIGFVVIVLGFPVWLRLAVSPVKTSVRLHITCNNNLRQIGLAFKIWAGDHNDKYPMQLSVTNGGTLELVSQGKVFPHFQAIAEELVTPKVLICPQDRDKSTLSEFTTNFDDDNISYFVGLNASESSPDLFLCGDRNMQSGNPTANGILEFVPNQTLNWSSAIHNGKGNVLFADGDVRTLTNGFIVSTNNRLAIP